MMSLGWNGGLLVSYFSRAEDARCTTTVFDYFNPKTGQIETTGIPPLEGGFLSLINGAGNDLWGIIGGGDVYYYSSSLNQWASVDFYPLTSYFVWAIDWNSQHNYLLVSVQDTSTSPPTSLLLKIGASAFPPSNPEILVTGNLAFYGSVFSSTAIKQQNSTNYGLLLLLQFLLVNSVQFD